MYNYQNSCRKIMNFLILLLSAIVIMGISLLIARIAEDGSPITILGLCLCAATVGMHADLLVEERTKYQHELENEKRMSDAKEFLDSLMCESLKHGKDKCFDNAIRIASEQSDTLKKNVQLLIKR